MGARPCAYPVAAARIGPLDSTTVPSDGRDLSRRGTNANAIVTLPAAGSARSSETRRLPQRPSAKPAHGTSLGGAVAAATVAPPPDAPSVIASAAAAIVAATIVFGYESIGLLLVQRGRRDGGCLCGHPPSRAVTTRTGARPAR